MVGREWELDETGLRTGRWRPTQFIPTPRHLAIPPSKRQPMPWRPSSPKRSQNEQASEDQDHDAR